MPEDVKELTQEEQIIQNMSFFGNSLIFNSQLFNRMINMEKGLEILLKKVTAIEEKLEKLEKANTSADTPKNTP